MSPSETALHALQARLPAASLRLDEAERYRASMDNLRLSRLPAVVIHPPDEAAVGTVLELANLHRVPVTVRGAGSATTGAATPLPGGWVLDFSSWRQVQIERATMMAYVQPGVTVQALDEAARAEGLFYPPDPGSKKYATIGGTLACNAGGLRGARYGVTRDYVYALEGFLPTGEFVRWGSNLRKDVSGYNVRDLWIGSEGTLGVITGAVLKLLPAPAARSTVLAVFETEDAALDTIRAILEAPLLPTVLEFLDDETVECFRRSRAGGGVPEWFQPFLTGPVLLIEFDGHRVEVEENFGRLLSLLKERRVLCKATHDEAEAEELWTIRRGCSKAMFQLGDAKLNEDIVVPLPAQKALFTFLRELRRETGLPCPTFGHAADGNFHVHIMYHQADPSECQRAEEGIARLMEEVVRLGGAISGEHGIGLAKSPFLGLQHSPVELRVMRALKELFDPHGILNPDKLFTPFRIWEHAREQVHLPWDH
jgi:glycolate oxidase